MSKLDLTKLTNVVQKDGKTIARCPACSARGGDAKGNNLVVYADGKFGCAAFPQDKEHNRSVFALVGVKSTGNIVGSVPVRRVQHPPPKVIKIVGRLGRNSVAAHCTAAVEQGQAPEPTVEPIEGAGPKTGPSGPADAFKTAASFDVATDVLPEPQPVATFSKTLEPMGFVLREDGCFVDPKKLDSGGNPKVVARSGGSR